MSVSSVIAAVVSAKSRSSAGALSCFRPKRTSLRPTCARRLRRRPAHLAGDLPEGGKALLERRMVHEELRGPLLDGGRDDEERVHPGHLAEVALRDAHHVARDLLERAHEVLGRAG